MSDLSDLGPEEDDVDLPPEHFVSLPDWLHGLRYAVLILLAAAALWLFAVVL